MAERARWLQSLAVSVVLAVALAASASCDNGNKKRAGRGELDFPGGPSTRSFDVEAPDPSTHTWDVRITAPLPADLAVRIRTPDSTDLQVVTSTKRSRDCRVEDDRRSCVLHFPALEARRPGKWTVVVRKLSSPPAKVSAELSFTPLS